jgi:glucose-1-phosphate cytidylyltransferase
MKAVILAGGLGTRIAEETSSRPKPMVEVGGKPILWHIMKMYSAHGINEFVICCGYKGYMIKEYFANYFLHMSDVTFDMANNNAMQIHQHYAEPWKITLIDTGENTLTGGRLRRVSQYLGNEDFCFTYGDGVGDVDLTKLIAFHKAHGKQATVTAVQPPGRFGAGTGSGLRKRLGPSTFRTGACEWWPCGRGRCQDSLCTGPSRKAVRAFEREETSDIAWKFRCAPPWQGASA